MVASLITRLVLLALARHDLRASVGEVVKALAVGEVYDLLAALWVAAPLVLVIALLPDRWWERRFVRGWMRVWLFFLFSLATFVVAAEVLFFDEFTGRFNFVAVDYLIFPTEVVTNLWESYPLPAILAGVVAIGALALWLVRRRVAAAFASRSTAGSRLTTLGAYAVALGVLTWVMSPNMARVSQDRALNEVALNGWYTFTLALLGQDAPYEGLYATRPAAAEADRLRRLVSEPTASTALPTEGIPTARRITPTLPEQRRNVVVVLEESLGADFVNALHPRKDTAWTPRYDSLITEGTLLANAYSTGNRTIRALEATTSSLPPLPGISIVRRAASQNLFTLPALLREHGYSTSFIYGGRALFDGMGSYMRANGMDAIIEQSDYPKGTFTTAWGVADEFIFDKALATFDSLNAAKRPFYSLVLSVSNHKPYDYPKGRINADPKARKRVNAVQYADWALGRFIRQAKDHPWFDNTLFVLMGDHGARVYGAAEIPLPSYRVPILFYAPGFIPAGQRVETMASNLDLPPTIMGRLGIAYDTRWFGHDIFSVAPDAGRALMTHNSEIALMRGNRMAVLGLKGAADVYAIDRASGKQSRVEHPDSSDRELVEDAIAYFHGADRMYRAGLYTMVPPAVVRAEGGRR